MTYTLFTDIAKLSTFGLRVDLIQDTHGQDQQVAYIVSESIVLIPELFRTARNCRGLRVQGQQIWIIECLFKEVR